MKNEKRAIVVTSISQPNDVLQAIAKGSTENDLDFIVIGDTKSPADFSLPGCSFFSVAAQLQTKFSFAQICPTKHYARKNIGYLIAIQKGAAIIQETDDDNIPRDEFFRRRSRQGKAAVASAAGWLNMYRYFTDTLIWPRGLPLDAIHDEFVPLAQLPLKNVDCPIQQGLADENPDVDAMYRLILPLPQNFKKNRAIALGGKSWCPFNSQNTMWWQDAFPLLYLPAYCSFRMTDIWRSFVAQRIARENNWHILFHAATVWQERNEHSLMKDFADEIPGYLHNRTIAAALDDLQLQPGLANLFANLRLCYQALVDLGLVGKEEMPLLKAWQDDFTQLQWLAAVSQRGQA